MKSFLDDLKIPEGCLLICHDANHNGDTHPGHGCGNPLCWKYANNSPSPRNIRVPQCRCPYGTFDLELM